MNTNVIYKSTKGIETNNHSEELKRKGFKSILVLLSLVFAIQVGYTLFQNLPVSSKMVEQATTTQESPVYEITLPEVVITAKRPVAQEKYLIELPEVVITAKQPVAQKMYMIELPEIVITPNK